MSSSSSTSTTPLHSTTTTRSYRHWNYPRAKNLVTNVSSQVQEETELECAPYFVDLSSMSRSQLKDLQATGLLSSSNQDDTTADNTDDNYNDDLPCLDICLLVDKHVQYLQRTWQTQHAKLRSSFVTLDASRPWMLYWTLHASDLLHHTPSIQSRQLIFNTLQACWTSCGSDSDNSSGGGFGGGPTQMPHAATTYAAVLALCILATTRDAESDSSSATPQQQSQQSSSSSASPSVAQQALDYLQSIRQPLLRWFMTLREPIAGSGVAVRMHHDGEMDVRATYCVMAVAKLLCLDSTTTSQLEVGLADYVVSCQTYEGGFGGEAWSEAHGGYTFCATAALVLLGHFCDTDTDNDIAKNAAKVDLPALTQWLAARQMSYEGGFSGRSNKLVDGCYSFWQGGGVAIVSAMNALNNPSVSYTREQRQDPWLNGVPCPPLIMDEALLQRYILLCAQDVAGGLRDKPSKPRDFYHSCYNLSGLSVAQHCGHDRFGHAVQSRVAPTHPVYNLGPERVRTIQRYFGTQKKEKE